MVQQDFLENKSCGIWGGNQDLVQILAVHKPSARFRGGQLSSPIRQIS
jgi:hypothetical protein